MEYVNQRGSFDDLPLDRMLADFARDLRHGFGARDHQVAADAGDEDFRGV